MPARARMISPGVGAILIITAWLAGQTLLPTEQRAFGDDPAAPQPLRAGGEPAPPCSDDVFLRRLHLDLVGRQPTSAEIEAFMADTSPGKRGAEVDRLLASPAWSQTWARYFRDVILFRRTDPQSAFMQTPLETFLASRLAADASWGAIARDLITATGAPGDHGETAIVMAQMGETADIAAEVSRIFLGIQLQCAQCHDHFTDRWKREQFHEFAAFFPRIAIRPTAGQGPDRFEVVSFDASPRALRGRKLPDNPRRGDLEHEMPDRDDPSLPGTVMTPRFFLTGQSLPQGTPDLERRHTVAAWITSPDNAWFSRAIVNRLWTELVGAGFYRDIDDLGPDRIPQEPQRLDDLAAGLAAHDTDLRWLFREICTSPEYGRESRSRSSPEREGFAANCPQRLRADQLFTQLLDTLDIDEERAMTQAARRQRAAAGAVPEVVRTYRLGTPRNLFGQVFGYDPSLPRDEIVGSIPQSLLFMNGPQVNAAIDGNRPGTMLGRLLRTEADDAAVAHALYLRTLSREPDADELQTCLAHVRESGDRAEGFEDVLWALINSAEFVHRP